MATKNGDGQIQNDQAKVLETKVAESERTINAQNVELRNALGVYNSVFTALKDIEKNITDGNMFVAGCLITKLENNIVDVYKALQDKIGKM